MHPFGEIFQRKSVDRRLQVVLYRTTKIDDIIAMPKRSGLIPSVLFIAIALSLVIGDGCKKKKATEPTPILPGINWTLRSTGGLYDLRDLATNGTELVAVGDSGRIITSADSGKSWTLRTSSTSVDLSGVTYLSSVGFVAVSSSGTGSVVLLSTNGSSWSAPPTSGISVSLNGVTSNNTTIAAVGCGGNIFTSTNGVSWSPRASGGTCVRAVERVGFSTVEFVAVGDSGQINTSSNGLVWPTAASNVLDDFYGIAGGCSKAVAVGEHGIIKTSANGSTWVTADSVGSRLNAVACGGDNFVAVGNSGVVYTSHDAGATWTSRTSATSTRLNAVIRLGGTYVAVGLDGTVVTSP